ncbi:MAG: hypothetical protein LBJ64_11650 [Deltaproteobacteria bacterium]|jgi:hypothetical protein|nr:hypothetical protein [Deltaproteobacteria bacterium]
MTRLFGTDALALGHFLDTGRQDFVISCFQGWFWKEDADLGERFGAHYPPNACRAGNWLFGFPNIFFFASGMFSRTASPP